MPSKRNKCNARFPPARIKKIMQKDEDVGKVAAAVPVIISRALELFLESFLAKTSEVTKMRNAKTLTTSHIKFIISSEAKFDFLKDLVADVADMQLAEEEGDVAQSTESETQPRPRGRPRKRRAEGATSIKQVLSNAECDTDSDSETEDADSGGSENEAVHSPTTTMSTSIAASAQCNGSTDMARDLRLPVKPAPDAISDQMGQSSSGHMPAMLNPAHLRLPVKPDADAISGQMGHSSSGYMPTMPSPAHLRLPVKPDADAISGQMGHSSSGYMPAMPSPAHLRLPVQPDPDNTTAQPRGPTSDDEFNTMSSHLTPGGVSEHTHMMPGHHAHMLGYSPPVSSYTPLMPAGHTPPIASHSHPGHVPSLVQPPAPHLPTAHCSSGQNSAQPWWPTPPMAHHTPQPITSLTAPYATNTDDDYDS